MKTVYCLVAAGLLFFLGAPTAQAQGTSMGDVYSTGKTLVEYIEALNKEVVHVECDIIGTDTKSIYRSLQTGWDYTITGFADSRVADLDVTVYKQVGDDWVEIVKDNMTDANPTVTLSPISASLYRIDVHCYKFQEGYDRAHYGLIVYHNAPE